MQVDRRLQLLGLLDTLKKKLDISTFDKRLTLQKTVYISQEMGIPLGYSFGWYYYGPYSPGLTKDAFELNLVSPVGLCHISLPKTAINGVKKLVTEIDKLPKREEGYWFELLSSLHFMFRYAYPKTGSEKEAIQRLMRSKPRKFNKEDAERMFKILRKYKLV